MNKNLKIQVYINLFIWLNITKLIELKMNNLWIKLRQPHGAMDSACDFGS